MFSVIVEFDFSSIRCIYLWFLASESKLCIFPIIIEGIRAISCLTSSAFPVLRKTGLKYCKKFLIFRCLLWMQYMNTKRWLLKFTVYVKHLVRPLLVCVINIYETVCARFVVKKILFFFRMNGHKICEVDSRLFWKMRCERYQSRVCLISMYLLCSGVWELNIRHEVLLQIILQVPWICLVKLLISDRNFSVNLTFYH